MKHKKVTEEVVAYIMTRTAKELSKLTRYEIAELFNINVSYLSRKFKEETQRTILDYIDFAKMLRAKILLEKRFDLTVEDISELLGIKKTNQFREKFKKYYYITPGKFRKYHKKRQVGTALAISPQA